MKDPAVLFYINDWLTSTAEMDSDCRGWYLNLLLHNYDKGTLPNDIEKLAVLCMVKFSEYERFKQVFEQVLKQKFEQIDEQRMSNLRTQTILKSREIFKEKRSDAGKMSYLMKFFAKNYSKQYKVIKIKEFIKERIDLDIDTKNQTKIEQMFEHLFELYRNENEIEDKIENKENIHTSFAHLKITHDEYKKLIDEGFKEVEIKDIFLKIENYKKNTKYKSLYLTALNWLKDKREREKTQTPERTIKDYL